MSKITMDDFLDECLTGKKPRKKRKRIVEEKKTDLSTIFEDDDKSVIDTDDANKKTSQNDAEEQKPEEEKTLEKDIVLSLILNINDEKKIKKYTKESFVDVSLNFQSILKNFDLDMEQISEKVTETPSIDGELPKPETTPVPGETEASEEEKTKFNKFRLTVKEFVTSGAGSEKVELSWKREGKGISAIETAEVITSNGSMSFNDSPDPLQAALTTFDRIYYNDIIGKIRQELENEVTSE